MRHVRKEFEYRTSTAQVPPKKAMQSLDDLWIAWGEVKRLGAAFGNLAFDQRIAACDARVLVHMQEVHELLARYHRVMQELGKAKE